MKELPVKPQKAAFPIKKYHLATASLLITALLASPTTACSTPEGWVTTPNPSQESYIYYIDENGVTHYNYNVTPQEISQALEQSSSQDAAKKEVEESNKAEEKGQKPNNSSSKTETAEAKKEEASLPENSNKEEKGDKTNHSSQPSSTAKPKPKLQPQPTKEGVDKKAFLHYPLFYSLAIPSAILGATLLFKHHQAIKKSQAPETKNPEPAMPLAPKLEPKVPSPSQVQATPVPQVTKDITATPYFLKADLLSLTESSLHRTKETSGGAGLSNGSLSPKLPFFTSTQLSKLGQARPLGLTRI